MSFTTTVGAPNLLWSFNSSNVDAIQGIKMSPVPVYVSGKYGQGLSTVGISTYTTGALPSASNIFTNNGLTVSTWFQITAGGGAAIQGANKITCIQLASNVNNTIGNTNKLGISIGIYNGWKISYIYNDPGSGYREVDTTTIASLNTWYHICLVCGGSLNKNLYFYINGAMATPTIGSNPQVYTTDMTGTTAFNAVNNTGVSNNTYTISDTRVYNRALSASQVQAIYRQGGNSTFNTGFTNQLGTSTIQFYNH